MALAPLQGQSSCTAWTHTDSPIREATRAAPLAQGAVRPHPIYPPGCRRLCCPDRCSTVGPASSLPEQARNRQVQQDDDEEMEPDL